MKMLMTAIYTIVLALSSQAFASPAADTSNVEHRGYIVVSRDSEPASKYVNFRLNVSGNAAGLMKSGKVVKIEVPAGQHFVVSNLGNGERLKLEVAPGETVYVSADLRKKAGQYQTVFQEAEAARFAGRDLSQLRAVIL